MYQVLIIDDDKLERKGLISSVSWESCGMAIAGDVANAVLALDFLKTHRVDLCVVDISMPMLSGLDFIRESRGLYPRLQYVVLSFHEDFEYVQSALRLGALDYISKLRMEEMDCTEIFRRVGSLLDSLAEKPIQPAPAPAEPAGETEAPLELYVRQWRGLHWLFDEGLFCSLCETLTRSPLTLRQEERLLLRISQELESAFGWPTAPPFLSQKGEAAVWLKELRPKLYAWAEGQDDLSRVPVCILRAAGYVETHLAEKLKTENVAAQVNMSRGYFSVNFKAVAGLTFNDFLRNRRIELAKKLLRSRAVRPGDLAESVGYEDKKYFSRIFLEQVGCSCSAYAKQFSPAKDVTPPSAKS